MAADTLADFPLAGPKEGEAGKSLFKVRFADLFELAPSHLAGEAHPSRLGSEPLQDASRDADARFAMFVGVAGDAFRIDAEHRAQKRGMKSPAGLGKECLLAHPAAFATGMRRRTVRH